MTERFPGYDVLDKRDTPSWNDASRRAIDHRLSLSDEPRFLTSDEWRLLVALCDRVVPQPSGRPRIPVAVLIDRKLQQDQGDGYRQASMPPLREAWRQGLHALNEEARLRFGADFVELTPARQDTLLELLAQDQARSEAWQGLGAKAFFKGRVLHDIGSSYYAFPESWNQIGFGGPASPRGYVRMGLNRRDPWEAIEAPSRTAEGPRRKGDYVG
jgi:hypothetical protein